MKPVCCDTSFLLSLYGSDVHTSRAIASARGLGQPLTLSVFNEFEFEQTLRLAVWRKNLSTAQAARIEAAFEADCLSEILIIASCNLSDILTESRRLSSIYTAVDGYRAFDILLVAASLRLG